MSGKREQALREKLERLTRIEREYWANGLTALAGIDEAGRGPLAGPVVAACVVMPQEPLLPGVDDSKKISEKRREDLYEQIKQTALDYCVSTQPPELIDEINILRAARKAFEEALNGLRTVPQHVFTDAMEIETELPYTSLIKGDATMYVIAAASILAKVTRDHIMLEYDKLYPEYGFAQHKGYGTKQHYAAIERYGILDIHRKTFLKRFL